MEGSGDREVKVVGRWRWEVRRLRLGKGGLEAREWERK